MVFRKVMVVSVIVNMSILKSPIVNDGFFMFDSICSTVCIYIHQKGQDWSIQVDGISQQLTFSQSHQSRFLKK